MGVQEDEFCCEFRGCVAFKACNNVRMSISLRIGAIGTLLLIACVFAFAPKTTSAAQVNVSMGAANFAPSQINVSVGDTVVWTNTSSMTHTVTANGGAFSSGTMQPSAVFSRTFTAPGSYSYHCQFHPDMVGTISVFAAPTYAQPQTYAPPQTYYAPQTSSTYVPPSTADQLRAQTQALLARVQQLQAQLATGGSAPAGSTGAAYDSSSCPLIGRSLKRGASGDDVTRLQQFLARDPSVYPEGLASGFYGALTEAAVKRWQVKYNIVSSGSPDTTGYGVVGPRTAAAIALLCTTGSYGGVPGPGAPAPVGGFIQVTPITGNAPLSVAIQATVNTVNSCGGATYVLDYGDGTQPAQIAVPTGNCTQLVQALAHQYRYGGTYLVTLSAGAHRTSATVQVYGAGPPPLPPPPPPPPPSSPDSVSASPTSGSSPLAVKFTGTINGSASCNGGAYLLDFGDNSNTEVPFPADACRAFAFEVNHTYASGGNFIARLYRDSKTPSVSQVSISVTGPTPSTTWAILSVTPAVGGNPLAVSVQTEYPACAAYSVDWGDGTIPASVTAQSGCTGSSSSATVDHTYSGAGDYTISLRDGNGTVKATSGIVII